MTVWDWKSGDPVTASYYDKAKTDFEAAHPGVTINFLMQPHDQYYTLLGTALSSNAGPDVILRMAAPRPRNASARWSSSTTAGRRQIHHRRQGGFTGADGGLYGIPLSIQGFVVYYNKARYTEAGLDAEKPPDHLGRAQDGVRRHQGPGRACFALGNKEGFGAEFFFSAIAANSLTAQEQADWQAGKLKWSTRRSRRSCRPGSIPPRLAGIRRAQTRPPSSWTSSTCSCAAKAANTIGLISDVAHWKQFDEFLGADVVGVFMPSPTVAADKDGGGPAFRSGASATA